jgi:hypothetical protein
MKKEKEEKVVQQARRENLLLLLPHPLRIVLNKYHKEHFVARLVAVPLY